MTIDKKIKEHGFSAVDFGMADTGTVIYTASQEESDAFLINEKRMAEEAGIIINQVHGPWRWPARDFEPEDRAERMEKMKKSIRATYVLGCKNWVIDWTDFSKSLKDINFDGVFSLETVPPAHLSDDLFEKCALLLSGIAKDIIDKA